MNTYKSVYVFILYFYVCVCQPVQLVQTVFVFVIDTGHGPLPPLTGNVSEVLVSTLLQSCYLSSQALPRVYQHYGPSPIQPLSTEMQILLTVYYLVQLGQFSHSPGGSWVMMKMNSHRMIFCLRV